MLFSKKGFHDDMVLIRLRTCIWNYITFFGFCLTTQNSLLKLRLLGAYLPQLIVSDFKMAVDQHLIPS